MFNVKYHLLMTMSVFSKPIMYDDPEAESLTATLTAVDRPWHVVVCNDPVNLMTYVVMVLQKVFGYSMTKAKKHMLEVHEIGESIVWTGEREKAENFVYLLQQWQLTAMLRQDDA